jgi:hypothetical protein
MKTNPTPYGENPALDALYDRLGVIEEKEIFCIEAGLIGRLPEVRESMLPLKRAINAIEGFELYDLVEETKRLDNKLSNLERDLNGLPNDDPRRIPLEAEYGRVRRALYASGYSD